MTTISTVPSLAYHSGQVAPGGVFVALKGAKTDGHRFISQALARGAKAMVTEEGLEAPAGVTVVRVPEARLALAHLSCAFYGHPSRELVLVGITGTNGKTSTSFLLEAILRAAGHRVGVIGTVNYRRGGRDLAGAGDHPGIPGPAEAPAAMRYRGVSHVVMEVSSHALDLHRVDAARLRSRGLHQPLPGPPGLPPGPGRILCRQVPPVFLESGQRRRASRPGGPQPGRPRGRELHARVRGPEPHLRLPPRKPGAPSDLPVPAPRPAGGLATSPAGEMEIDSRLVGPFNLANILAAAATALGLGLAPAAVSPGHRGAGGVPGRLERFGPAAGPEHLRGLRPYPGCPGPGPGRLAAPGLCPDHHRLRLRRRPGPKKRPLMGQAAGRGALVVVTSDNPRTEDPLAIIQEIEPGLSSRGSAPAKPGRGPAGGAGLSGGPGPQGGHPPGRGAWPGPATRCWWPARAMKITRSGATERRHFDDREEVAQALKEYHG